MVEGHGSWSLEGCGMLEPEVEEISLGFRV